jgi:hypothetical protein
MFAMPPPKKSGLIGGETRTLEELELLRDEHHLTIAVCGHKGSGKSTIIVRLRFQNIPPLLYCSAQTDGSLAGSSALGARPDRQGKATPPPDVCIGDRALAWAMFPAMPR